MATLFHATGVLVWYDSPKLKHYVIIDPQWLANIMATLVSFKVDRVTLAGKITFQQCHEIWKTQKIDEIRGIIALLEHFEILMDLKVHSACPKYIDLALAHEL